MASPSTTSSAYVPSEGELFGHPTGLFALFFAEMWERFSYYGMRALLVFYMLKGFLAYGDTDAYRVYGAYTSLVYMTPFFGGLIADRLLGARRAVVLGGLLMAAGHLLMTVEAVAPFYVALALLIVGNGFFKPNISTIVGSLYPEGSSQRDAGFTLFYMGINLGAAMAPLLCGYIGETYGWHKGFGLATVGMMIGLAVFVVPNLVARVLILGGALVSAVAMVALQSDWLLLLVNGFVAVALVIAGVIAFTALGRAGLPEAAGGPPDPEALRRPIFGIPAEFAVYLGVAAFVPVAAGMVWANRAYTLIPDDLLKGWAESPSAAVNLMGTLAGEVSTPTGLILAITGLIALGYLAWSAFGSPKVERERLMVVVTMMVFSMLFWAFFEQAGTSMNNFADRNIDRVREERVLTQADVGQTLELAVNQEQLGYRNGTQMFTLDQLDKLRTAANEKGEVATVSWEVDAEDVGMGIQGNEIPASTFQSANPIFILVFGLVFSMLWNALGKAGLEPNTPIKFALGLAQLSLGFAALWYGASVCDPRGMVAMSWLLLGYLLHTTGELCLSPVGLAMVTKLSPTRLVSTVMGAWFLATSFSNYLGAIIAAFTGIGHGGGDEKIIPPPIDTVHVYGGVFGQIAVASMISAVILLLISPLLARAMHGVK